jgi:dienelactone hydrolase
MVAHHDIGISNGRRSKTSTASLTRRSGNINLWLLGGVVVGVFFLSLLGIAWYLLSTFQPATSLGMPGIVGSATESLRHNNGGAPELDLISSKKLASLSPLPAPKKLRTKDLEYYDVSLDRALGKSMRLFIYMPPGDSTKKMPVVFEAPSGTPLLHGADIGTAEGSAELLPFVEEGMITVTYSIDGHMPEGIRPDAEAAFMAAMSVAYRSFTEADAGVENGKAAIDFVLAQLPQADPERLYTWGHSSSATLALLLASKDQRIKKCIALAPITDLQPRLGDLLKEPSMMRVFPNIADYLKSGSPASYVNKLKIPVFLAHAKDDDNEPHANSTAYVNNLKSSGGTIEFLSLPRGGHYQELIMSSMPKAIEWLKKDSY